jgi:DNA-directed RNA polymerase specialized sigma24 family protein
MEKTKLHLQTEMETSTVDAPEKSKSNVILLNPEAFQHYITSSVNRHLLRTSLDLIPSGERSFVIEDVSQNSWLKLLTTKKSSEVEMTSPKGYVASVVRSESIDEIRRRKRKSAIPLPLDQDGEVLQSRALLAVHEGMRDPADEYELKEFVTEIVDEILQLPSKQKYVMICVLKDEIGHTFCLTEIFQEHGIDIEAIHWPREAKELQQLRSLLSVARRTLRKKFDRPVPYPRSGKVHHAEKRRAILSEIVSLSDSKHEDGEV